jgi:hypothetical protein
MVLKKKKKKYWGLKKLLDQKGETEGQVETKQTLAQEKEVLAFSNG